MGGGGGGGGGGFSGGGWGGGWGRGVDLGGWGEKWAARVMWGGGVGGGRVIWRRMTRRARVKESRSGSISTSSAASAMTFRMAWWVSSMAQTSWRTISGVFERSTRPFPRWLVLSSPMLISSCQRSL